MNLILRREYVVTLKMALENCLPQGAEEVVGGWLAERRQIGPTSPLEHFAYLGAIITEMALTNVHPNIRKQMMVCLWHGFDERTHATFLRKFGP